MDKKYKVVFYSSGIVCDADHPYIKKGTKISMFVTASSKADALMYIALDYYVYSFVSVERIK